MATELQEFALALAALLLAVLPFSLQIYEWKGFSNSFLTRIVKWFSACAIVLTLVFVGIVLIKLKGTKPWSNIDPVNALLVATGAGLQFIFSVVNWSWLLPGVFLGWLLAIILYRVAEWMDAPISRAFDNSKHQQDEVGRLQQLAQNHSVRVELLEGQLKQLKSDYAVAIEMADYQASRIADFVEVVRTCTHDAKLDDDLPTIRWGLLIKNRSVFRISLDGEAGPLYFDGRRLSQPKELKSNDVHGLPPDREGAITYEQQLSGPEVEMIKRRPNGKFEFDKVTLSVKGYPDSDRVKSRRLIIFPEFRAELERCSDLKSQATEEIATERDALKNELTAIKSQITNSQTEVEKALIARNADFNNLQQQHETLRNDKESLERKLNELSKHSLFLEVDVKGHRDARDQWEWRHSNVQLVHDKRVFDPPGIAPALIDKYVLKASIYIRLDNRGPNVARPEEDPSVSLRRDSDGYDLPLKVESYEDGRPKTLVQPIAAGHIAPSASSYYLLDCERDLEQSFGALLDSEWYLRITLEAINQRPYCVDLNVNWDEARAANNMVNLTFRRKAECE